MLLLYPWQKILLLFLLFCWLCFLGTNTTFQMGAQNPFPPAQVSFHTLPPASLNLHSSLSPTCHLRVLCLCSFSVWNVFPLLHYLESSCYLYFKTTLRHNLLHEILPRHPGQIGITFSENPYTTHVPITVLDKVRCTLPSVDLSVTSLVWESMSYSSLGTQPFIEPITLLLLHMKPI